MGKEVQMTDLLAAVMRRELAALARELALYPEESYLWARPPGVPNTAGNLALHIIGNLRALIGAALGDTGYERDRDAEFAKRAVPRDEILAEIDVTIREVEETLRRLGEKELAAPYPLPVAGVRVRVDDFLLHLAGHLSFHLGQIDYHRRIVSGESKGAGVLPIPELATASTK